MNEEDVQGILLESDECIQLSFSAPSAVVVDEPQENASTSSEEDLLLKNAQHHRQILIDEADLCGIDRNKIGGLFRSGDTDSGSDYEDSDNNAPVSGGLDGTSKTSKSSEEGHGPSASIIAVREIIIDEAMEEGSKRAVGQIIGTKYSRN